MGTATKTISYGYDASRNRTLMIDPDGGRTTYAYDALNRITSLINPQGDRTTYAYDAKGRRTVKKLANGTRASFTYDAASRLTTLANLKSDSSVISKFDYKYDKVGNRTEVAEADGSRVTWSYDNTYQLTAEHRTGNSPYRNTFTYDSVGNRLVKNENNARTTYVYDAANQLKTSVDAQGTTTYTFDNDGNQQLIQAPTSARTTTTWDYENKTTLVELSSGTRSTMSYEPDGLRVKLEESSGTKKFIWDDQNHLAETDKNNDVNVIYTNEPAYYGKLISQHRKSGVTWTPSYYHQEALGSTRELTSNLEAVTDQYLYDAWGNVITSTGTTINPFQWTGNVGYYFDTDTGNFYIRARIYEPTIGRWLSVDPVEFLDGINLYQTRFIPNDVDPSGLCPVNSNCPKRDSELVRIRPRGGQTSNDIGVQMVLSPDYAALGVDPPGPDGVTLGPCGAFAWLIYWKKTNHNRAGRPTYVIQNIRMKYEIFNCCGEDVTIEYLKSRNLYTAQYGLFGVLDFWEAWQFEPGFNKTVQNLEGSANIDIDDRYHSGPVAECTYGRITINGRYTEVDGVIPNPPMSPGNVRFSGVLPSSYDRPPFNPKGPFREHSLEVEFDCCPEGNTYIGPRLPWE